MLITNRLKDAGIPYQPLVFYHDEVQFAVPTEFKDKALEISKKAFEDGPRLFGITIMSGESKSGNNWFDTH